MSGQHDFDFLFAGPWRVANRRLGADGGWQEFDAHSEVRPLLGGLGHLDELHFAAFPGVGEVRALTVRLYDPGEALWRIWWSSSTRPGHLDEPMLGRFEDGVGRFEGTDALAGEDVALRFLWTPQASGGPRWEQARSRDGGTTWTTDWVMTLAA